MTKIFAFDLGISSVGWAYTIRKNDTAEIVDSGSRIFNKAEHPKNGSSLALPRRQARSSRKNTNRKRGRIYKIKLHFAKTMNLDLNDILQDFGDISNFFKNDKHTLSPWQLRNDGLNRKLNKDEWLRVLIHIAKNRAYSSNKVGNEENNGKVLRAIEENNNLLKNKSYLTVGQMMYNEFFEKKNEENKFINVRNKKDSYRRSISRKQTLDETKILFEKQREFNNEFANVELEKFYVKTAFYQRKIKSFENLIGFCKYIEGEKRAPKNSISAQEFIALSKTVNTLANIENSTGLVFDKKETILTVFKTLKDTKTKKITYSNLRNILQLDDMIEFYGLDYHKSNSKTGEIKSKKKIESENIFIELKTLKLFNDIFKNDLNKIPITTLDTITTKITIIKDDKELKKELGKLLSDINLESKEEIIDKLSQISFSGHIELSLKALYQIIPFMKDGKRYDESLILANLEVIKPDSKYKLLPPFNDTMFANSLTNPVVARAISEYRKVLNSMIKKYGSPHKIHIELTREVGKNFQRRKEIEKEQKENRESNEKAKEKCEELGITPNHKNILKLKLWVKQKEISVYSGKKIEIKHLQDENFLEIDHIYPFSRSYDDSQHNKILAFRSENQNKGNKTPYEWLGQQEDKWEEFVSRVFFTELPKNSKKRLINKNFKDKNIGEQKEFLSRNLNDTSYIAKLVKDYTLDYLEFLPLDKNETQYGKGSKQHIVCINGSLTTMLRHFWGLDSKNRDNHLHHAEDAMILSLITNQNVKAYGDYKTNLLEYKTKKAETIANELKQNNDFRTKALLKCGADDFRKIVNQKTNEIFVSLAPRRKVGGAFHQETIYSKEEIEKYYKYDLQKINNYLECGVIVKLNRGYAKNETMPRADIFQKDGKFYIVPVYSMHFATGTLPNKAISGAKDGWKEMDETYKFCFSLFKNDLIKLLVGSAKEPIFCYYIGLDVSSSGRLIYKTHLSSNELRSSIGTIKNLEKYEISPIGNIKKFDFQERQPVKLKTTKRN
ncbi:MAG: type II CRISPR RNA-guided endonuclease Cas9 [Campylobacter sp.]|nr:type II CRISPR RNA-guided endonuclease Cas9 [Campylobacter sp.]